MMLSLPEGHKPTNSPSFRNALAVRAEGDENEDDENEDNEGEDNEGKGSKNKGKQKGPPSVTEVPTLDSSPGPPAPSTALAANPPAANPPAANPPASNPPPLEPPPLEPPPLNPPPLEPPPLNPPPLETPPLKLPAPITASTPTSSPDLASSPVLLTPVVPPSSESFRTPAVPATLPVPGPAPISTSSWPTPSGPGTSTNSLNPTAPRTLTGTLATKPSTIESLTTSVVSASSNMVSTSTYPVSGSLSSTMLTTFSSTAGATAIQTEMVYNTPNGTAESTNSAMLPGQKAGIALGAIGGFAFTLTLIFLMFKCRRAELRKALPRPLWRLPDTWGNSRRLSRIQTPDAMSDSLLAAEVGSSSPAWDYQATFAPPTVIEKARRSLPKSLTRLLRVNPLGLNPVAPQATWAKTPSRKSFASFFHRRSAASTHRSAFSPSFLQGQSGSVIDQQSPPPIPPLDAALPSPRPSGRSIELPQSGTDDSQWPLATPTQVPPRALRLSWHNRNSQITMASAESEARSFKSMPGWVKFDYSHRLRSDREVPQDSGKALLPPPLPISPGSWLKRMVLRRSQSTTASDDEKGDRLASHNGGESTGTK